MVTVYAITDNKAKKLPFPNNDDLVSAFRSAGKSMRRNGLATQENKETKEPQGEIEEVHRQTENLDGILAEREAVYGDYGIHVEAVGDIMIIRYEYLR